MKKIVIVGLLLGYAFAWEVNTHRAIDRAAIAYSRNLSTFVQRSGIGNAIYDNEIFEDYVNKRTGGDIKYLDYINPYFSSDSISELRQTFSISTPSYKKLLEVGTMLEDAVYPDASLKLFGVDGRFNNHFCDPQNGGHALTYGYGKRVNAVTWATNGGSSYMGDRRNRYDFNDAYDYFYKGFTESDPAVRRKYQAKMLVAVGHLMHMVNDMKKEVCYVRMA